MGVWEVAGPGRGWDRDAHRSHSGENPKAKLAEPARMNEGLATGKVESYK